MTAQGPIEAGTRQVSLFSVEGMRCAACIGRIERSLPKVSGVYSARVNLAARRVRVEHEPGVPEEAMLEGFRSAGFDAHPFAGEVAASGPSKESRRLLLALGVAGFAMMNIMLLSVSVWSGAEGMTRQLFHWISALIALPTVAYSGRPFFASAWSALRKRRTNMDVPISIGVLLTTAMSLYETATGGHDAYFDGVVMLLFFLLAGRYLDSVMRARAEDSIAALLRRVPGEATYVTVDGRHERRDVASLMPGDLVLVAAGERVAVDGEVLEGSSELDRSLVTGESLPDTVAPGGAVLAGTINLGRPLTVRATAVGENTAIADIARLMENAGQGKSRFVVIADKAARLYAPAVHTLAALTFLGWLLAGAGVHDSLLIGVAVLIITCPCALGLAVPVAQVVAAGALMKKGVLVKDGSALERLASADMALFDKTGTATIGSLVPANLPEDDRERAILAALARASRHPLARATTCALEGAGTTTGEDVREVAGLGVEGHFEGKAWRFGRPDWVGYNGEVTTTAAAFGRVGRQARLITFADSVRPDGAAAMERMESLGVPAQLVSGDTPEAVARIAAELRVSGNARVSPAEKAAMVARLRAKGHRVLMVGDGLNDGPALKAAHVAMAPSTASDVGQMAADAVFFGEGLGAVPMAVAAARRTMRVVKQNFALAVGYNLLAVPLAIAGKVTPLVAAIAMSGSSIIVVANALRLKAAAR